MICIGQTISCGPYITWMETTMPPTTHVIPDTDRQRLVRSIRKIGSVLGETPLLEANSAPAHQHSSSSTNTGSRRLGPFFQSLSSLSLSPSDASSSKSDSGHSELSLTRPSLCLRVPDVFEPLPPPLSPTFSPSLASPLTPPDNDDSTRRRTMAKLTRTLGENVPPELVFSAPVKRRRRASTLIMPESALEQMTFAAAGTLAVERDAGWRSSINSGGLGLKRALSFVSLRSVTAPPEVPASSMSPTAEVHVHPMRSSDEEDTPNPASEWLYATKETPNGTIPTDDLPAYKDPYAIPHRRAQEFALHRREGSWTGDWEGNVGNMDDVMQRLRGLRAK
ncbi:hypothetical protein B0H10DRAFT_2063619 [Mycena sp. CBHHK59/15]|nr:hypothetical protein B0H10DRAFT_2063619 [Mycena sp. CBHHK59/15]